MKAEEIRQQFLDFFKSKKHQIVPSAPIVVKDDPTLMFTNAGMNQFKEFFLGNGTPKSPRIADTQKCLRVSGKHNDLEEVGKDTYHHTMFEMMGNWSFGDYFKKEAIEWAWELLTEVYKIDRDRIYVTIFEGDEQDGLTMDKEAYDFWKTLVPEERILQFGKKDNFWEMGDQGPCGPCSEIHVDIRPEAERVQRSGAELVNKDHPMVIEIWNLVFMEFNRKTNGSLESLPAKHIDTGMGFERLCMVLQEVTSSYDSDIFTPLTREIQTITNVSYGDDEAVNIAIRVIADHLRAVSFAVADGQLPSNTGAGYVIRRILRRAIRYGFTYLKQKEPFIHKLVVTLSKQMGKAFPELMTQRNLIINVIREEESSFLRTLEQGLILLANVALAATDRKISGEKAFELYDTYGFPIDLTELILKERGFELDRAGFDSELQQQKKRSRAATALETGDWHILYPDDEEEFIGYDTLETQVKVTRYRKVSNKKEGELYHLVFNITPFYPESGGQVGDKGYLQTPDGDVVYIVDTKRENNLIVHHAKALPKDPTKTFTAVVDALQRGRTAANHTATHLLHQALRSVLGDHVEQKGSMVHNSHLRFDFSHFSKLTKDESRQVSDFVIARIQDHIPREEHRKVPFPAAIEQGAIALFGEKYGDTVRTIRFGKSIELCGGTHVENTGDIWHFIITSESAIAAGIRRIEAITGDAAKLYFKEQTAAYQEVKALLKNPKSPVQFIENLQMENSHLKKQLEQLLKEKTMHLAATLKQQLQPINGVRFLATEVGLGPQGIKDLLFTMGDHEDDLFLVIGHRKEEKALLSCYISKKLVQEEGYNAAEVIKALGTYIQGGGGGQPFFATAGGRNLDGIPQALSHARKFVKGTSKN